MPPKKSRKTPPPAPKLGIGQQLGGMLDQMFSGQAPTKAQLEELAANVVGRAIGRDVTIEEVRQVRAGDYAPLKDAAEQFQRARAARSQAANVADPSILAKIERLKDIGRARAVMGFTKDDPLTADVIKQQYRALAKRHHSDATGGSDEKMVRINWARDILVNSLT